MSTVSTGAGAASAPIDPPAGFQPEQPKSLLSYAKYADPFVVFAWVMSTIMPFSWAGPLRYLVAGYFTAALFLFARQTMPAVVRSWPLFILAVVCLISSTWALSPNGAVRFSLQLAMTAVIGIYIATRVKGRHILLGYFAAEFIAVLLCIITPNNWDRGAWSGIFGQKNNYAINMFFFYVTSLGLALDLENPRWLRRFATAMVPVGIFMVLMAKSGTTTLMLIGATAIMAGQVLIWQPASRIRHGRLLIVMTFAALAVFGAFIVFGLMQRDVMADVLGALGKDSTLTGRTMMWEIARREMAEHPWTGLGPEGFWNWNTGIAHNLVTEQFGIGFNGQYSFHNSYYQNGVDYGYPGFFATVFLATWTLSSAALTWIRNQSVVNATFLMIAAMVILRSNSESDLGGVFGSTVVLLYIAAARKEFGKRSLADAVRSFTTRVRP